MRVPPGVYRYDAAGKPLVCKLRRSLYGLKQAGREWGELFASFLTKWGLVRSTIDTCLYIYREGGELLWVLVYVDDALVVDNSSVNVSSVTCPNASLLRIRASSNGFSTCVLLASDSTVLCLCHRSCT